MLVKEWIGTYIIFKLLKIRYKTSWGIHNGPTYGYGKLDHNGYWEYSIHPRHINNRNRNRRID